MILIEVGCAIIEKQGQLLIAQRKPGDSLGGYWEFPGGKIEQGESMENCLVREVKEELGIEIRVRRFLERTEYLYSEKKLGLNFYLCDWVNGTPEPLDCQGFCWVNPSELRNFVFPPADAQIINDLIQNQRLYFGKC